MQVRLVAFKDLQRAIRRTAVYNPILDVDDGSDDLDDLAFVVGHGSSLSQWGRSGGGSGVRTPPRGAVRDQPAAAAAPETISISSFVIRACRARLYVRVRESISSPAFLEAPSMAVIRAPFSAAFDSSRMR